MSQRGLGPQPSIEDYGFLGDCHSVALVSRQGSIDWCCLPRIDSESCFGRLLDWDRGGHFAISPKDDDAEIERGYVDGSLVLETRFSSASGQARLLDFFSMREGGDERPHRQVVRLIEGVRGTVKLEVELCPRFDFGSIRPWIRPHGEGLWTAIGGDLALIVRTDLPLVRRGEHDLALCLEIHEGERRHVSLEHLPPQEVHPEPPEPRSPEEPSRRLDETLEWWRHWGARATFHGDDPHGLLRSAMVIKGLVHAPTGAIAAAATTSLPEELGGSRNWDYRMSWIRDSTFAVRALSELGFRDEAQAFASFVERTAAGSGQELQVVYGVRGEHRLTEIELGELAGYQGSRPVRIGNDAYRQRQLDLHGDLLDLAWRAAEHERTDDDYWAFLCSVVEQALRTWEQPDHGVWEIRGAPKHFVYSKIACWAAVDRALRLAEREGREVPTERWTRARDLIRSTVEEKGVDPSRGVLVQAFGRPDLDAALLLVPRLDFLPWDDPVMVRTVDAIQDELEVGEGLLRRYVSDDGIDGDEGAFLACSFWLAECLAYQSRAEEAKATFARVATLANDLGLFSEEYDVAAGRMIGNFPQGLTHYGHVAAAVAIARGRPPRRDSEGKTTPEGAS